MTWSNGSNPNLILRVISSYDFDVVTFFFLFFFLFLSFFPPNQMRQVLALAACQML